MLQKTEILFFEKFEGSEKSIKRFKEILKNFEGGQNQFFDAVIYGIMYYRCDCQPIDKEIIVKVLGENLFSNLKEIEGKKS